MDDKHKSTNTAKARHNSVDQSASEEKQPITAPMAMAELEIMKVKSAKSVSDQKPEVRNIALLFLLIFGITLLGQISSYLIARSSNDTQTSFLPAFVSSNGVFGIALLLAQVIAIFILLLTRNTSHAKTIILIAGIGFAVALVKGIFSFQIGPAMMVDLVTLAVNFVILQKVFKAYLDL